MDAIQELKDFLDSAHSPYHTVALLTQLLQTAGYHQLQEKENWTLQPGAGYFVIRNGSALLAFRIPEGTPSGFMMAASHDDFPTFGLKESMEHTGSYTRMDVEGYGGMLMSTWLDRPLSVAGRVLVQTETGAEHQLIDIDRDLALIPSVAIHINREANDGYKWNPAVDLQPLLGGADAKGKLRTLLEEAAGGTILGTDLHLYVRQKSSVWGLEEAYLSGAGLDDLTCVWCSAKGFLDAESGTAIPVLCVFDNEEVGSGTLQGAGSNLLESTVERICRACSLEKDCMLSQSFMISADNGHAMHPNHPEYADRENAPVLGGGVLLKFQTNRRYTTDGMSGAVFRRVCEEAGAAVQSYYNRADIAGGSTLGNVSLAHVSVPSVDIGLPQLAMHSAYETVAVKDTLDLYRIFRTYYGKSLTVDGEGSFKLK